MAGGPLLEIDGLSVEFRVPSGTVRAVKGVSLAVQPGEVLGIVGESGSGKSVLTRTILGLIPENGRVVGGEVRYKDRSIGELRARELRDLRLNEVSMVFQDPGAYLNPVFTIGQELVALIRLARGVGRAEARHIGESLLERVGIPDPARRFDAYPHELSGGQKQRVMIAMAIANRPSLLLADEPTTALDVTIQDQILRLLVGLKEELGMSMILVSHDIGVVSRLCTSVAVMYAGRVVEVGPVRDVLAEPRHPYTRALLASVPRIANIGDSHRELRSIPGAPPDLSVGVEGCPFARRCDHASGVCGAVPMVLEPAGPGRLTACPIVPLEGGRRD